MSTNIRRIMGKIYQIGKRLNSIAIIYKYNIIDSKNLLEKQEKDINFLREKLHN